MKYNINNYTGLGMVSILLWATNSAVTIKVVRKLGPFSTLSTVMLLAGGLLAFYEVIRYKRLSAIWNIDLRYAVFGGIFFLLHEALFYIAFYLSSTDMVALQLNIINYLWPIFVIVFSVILLNYRIKYLSFLLGIVSGIIGIIVTINGKFLSLDSNLIPCILMLISSASWGVYSSLANKYHSPDKINGVPLFFLVIGGCAFLVSRLVMENPVWDQSIIWQLIYISLCPMALAYMLWENGVRRGNIVILGVSSYFLPLLSTLFAGYFLTINISMNVIWGAIMLILGAFLTERGIESQ